MTHGLLLYCLSLKFKKLNKDNSLIIQVHIKLREKPFIFAQTRRKELCFNFDVLVLFKKKDHRLQVVGIHTVVSICGVEENPNKK